MDQSSTAERGASGEVTTNGVREAQTKLLDLFNVHLMKSGQTQANLARIARVSPQTLQQVVKGQSKNREATNIIKAFLPAFWHDHMQVVPKNGG